MQCLCAGISLGQRSSAAGATQPQQQERACANAHISIRAQAAQAADCPPHSSGTAACHAGPSQTAPDQAAQLERLASGAQASSSQQQESQNWLNARRHAPPAEEGAAPAADPAGAARLQQLRYQLPLTAAQTQSLASRLQGLQPAPPLPQQHAVAQNPYTFKPYVFQPLKIADWRPQQPSSSSHIAAQALGTCQVCAWHSSGMIVLIAVNACSMQAGI